MNSSMNNMRLIAVVVTYNFNIRKLLNSIGTYSDYVSLILVCDNSTNDILGDYFSKEQNPKIQYYSMKGNKGIAYALNYGFNLAIKYNADWVLTMDQDSTFVSKLDGYFEIINDPVWENVSIQSPAYLYHDKDTDGCNDSSTSLPSVIKKSIQSGCLYRVSDFQKVGPFLDTLFIDYVDYEYCMRIAEFGKITLKVPSVVLKHKRGSIHQKKFFSITVKIAKSDPIRHYYQTRNFLLYFKLYRDYTELISRCLIFARVLALEDEKYLKTKYTFLGARDFFLGRWGKYIPSSNCDI